MSKFKNKKGYLPNKINDKIEDERKDLEGKLAQKVKEAFQAIDNLTIIQESLGEKLESMAGKLDVKFKKLNPKAVIPKQANVGDAGLDLTALKRTKMAKGRVEYSFGLSVEIPRGYVGLLFPRSSIYKKNLSLCNSVGVIDSGYRGELKAIFNTINDLHGTNMYAEGERVAQLVIVPIPRLNLIEVNDLSGSDRGEGGFGSSGQ